ncbi:MAG: PilZ domain-containing protein [Acidobacteria bacterium]|nr:PilZ domain-containing protein [Acidobacteriota bacterium]
MLYTQEVVSALVLIGPSVALPVLRKQLPADTAVQTFTDHEVRQAVEYIATTKPAVVAIDEEFAVGPRGDALIGRIVEDPSLASCEIRILPRAPRPERAPSTKRKSGANIPVAGSPTATASAVAAPPAEDTPAAARPLDQRGTRRAERFRLNDGVAVTVDGNAAELVDLSTVGAQVISKIVLKPNQKVRVVLPEETRVLRCGGSVVWATFEMPAGKPPRYRAGLRLQGLDVDAMQGFVDRHRTPKPSDGAD